MVQVLVADLKARLKELGMIQGGDRGTLEYRIEYGETSVKLGLTTPNGDPVHSLKIGKLKPCALKVGISPIGTLDEIMFAYIDHLQMNPMDTTPTLSSNNDNDTNANGDEHSSTTTTTTTGSGSGSGPTKTAQISTKVLTLAEEDDFVGILNLGGATVTSSSSVAILRKAYLKLSLILHPDKNRSCPDATKVFQALVNAYERISQPELVEEVDPLKKGQKKAAAISRSNDGCKRTRVRCPRCKNPWSESSVEGNPDYFFNFMMMGIKSFNCATCLLEFGCMTAIHECPSCQKSFEYHPSDFHRNITCGRPKCESEKKTFGFYMFHCSDRVLKDVKIDVQRIREEQAKTTEQKRRRAESYRRRRRRGGKCNDEADSEAAFLMGLANECPRCGISLHDMEDADEIDHLRNCNDEEKIQENKRKKESKISKTNAKKQRQELQDDVTAKATWDFLGASNENMWMLTDGALKKECKEHGVDTDGKESHDMIASLVTKKKSQALTKFVGKKGQANVTTESLPSNVHSMTAKQLRAVAASHGLKITSKMRKTDIIQLLQSEQEKESNSSTLMITDKAST